jgi:hypothetical protein
MLNDIIVLVIGVYIGQEFPNLPRISDITKQIVEILKKR